MRSYAEFHSNFGKKLGDTETEYFYLKVTNL